MLPYASKSPSPSRSQDQFVTATSSVDPVPTRAKASFTSARSWQQITAVGGVQSRLQSWRNRDSKNPPIAGLSTMRPTSRLRDGEKRFQLNEDTRTRSPSTTIPLLWYLTTSWTAGSASFASRGRASEAAAAVRFATVSSLSFGSVGSRL